MNKNIRHIETLIYYDGPELFLATDQIGTNYLCLLTERKEADNYLCAPISKSRLSEFYSGMIDLRDIYISPETEELFYIETKGITYEKEIPLKPISISDVLEAWLPEVGFKFRKELLSDEVITKEANERKRAVIHLSLNPPEARGETKIHAENLSQALKIFQRLIKFCYRKALKGISDEERQLNDLPENYGIDVFAFSEGSFTLHLQSSALADMVGYAHVSRALEKIDTITQTIDNPQATLEVLKKDGGHLVKTYRDLLEFIVKQDSPISYKWIMPELRKPIYRHISKEYASPVYDLLIAKQELGVEEKIIIGTVHKLDVDNGTWRLLSEEDGKSFNGKTDLSRVHLGGIIVETQRYKFICEERLEEETATGREIAVLWLVSFETL